MSLRTLTSYSPSLPPLPPSPKHTCTVSMYASAIIITMVILILLRKLLCPPRHAPLLPLHLDEASSIAYVVEETNQDATFEFAPRIGPTTQAQQQHDENGSSIILLPKLTNPYGSQIAVTLG